MEWFLQFIDLIGANIPGWLPLYVLPGLLVLIAVVLTLFGGRRLYWFLAAPIGGTGFFLILCITDTKTAFVFAGLYVVLAALLRLLFFIPCPRTYRKSERRGKREEKIYRKFRQDLTAQTLSDYQALPSVEESLEEPRTLTAEESGMRFEYVCELIGKLKKEELSAADRLELDALSRSVEVFRNQTLTEEELCVLNDCLAAVLKLTAKYKL